MTEIMEGQTSLFDQDTWCGKTYPEHSAATKEKTSAASLKKRQKSRKGMPLYLDLRKGNGAKAEPSWEMGGALLGEYTMHSFGECPKEENVSRLSQILEENPHPKYSLSAKACQGILSRASRRGKKLPPQLEEALIRQATPLKSEEGEKSKGHKAGKGALMQTELSGTLGVSQDQTLIQTTSDGSEVAGTLDASYYKGCGLRQGRERTVVYGISAGNNGGNPACNHGGMAVVYGFDPGASRDVGVLFLPETSKTLSNGSCPGHHNGVVYGFTYANDAYDKWSESEKGASLRASGGVYGGGSESLSVNSVVRRLTPLECERLQGYPDNWTNIGDWIDSKGKKHKGDADSPRYKALGNSIALPFWFYLLRRISAQYERPATLGSLFDGIGGFPLCWERCNGKGTARWASEIEEFPIAVTKHWFG